MIRSVVACALALLLAPLLPGIVNRAKAFFAGRRGPPLLQLYFDLAKLLGKGTVYSRSATWVLRAGPVVGLAATAACLPLLPLGGAPGLAAFPGDLFLFAYLLGLARFATILAALDTGSAFEGMGASREAWFSTLAEPALLLGLAGLAAYTGKLSLSGMFIGAQLRLVLGPAGPAVILIGAAFLLVFLAENSRIPFDDPNTHLELTMIHEVMVLDHGGPDLALIEYGSALKMWVLGGLMVDTLIPLHSGRWPADLGIALGGLALLAAATGVIESVMARLKLRRVPQALVMASVFSILALILVLR
jgi:formate hydrogenlyase subunit 4